MKQNSVIILILFFFLQSCERKTTDFEFEQNVFSQVFNDVVNSTYKDKRIYTFHCKNGNLIIEKGKIVGWNNPECEKQINSLKKDTLNLVVAINDTIRPMSSEEESLIPSEFTVLDSKPYKVKLEKYINQKFTYKYISELKPDDEFENWSEKYSKFVGMLTFSKIHFDSNRENGILNVSYLCGGKCGLGYIIYLKKTNGKWKVKKTKRTWIS